MRCAGRARYAMSNNARRLNIRERLRAERRRRSTEGPPEVLAHAQTCPGRSVRRRGSFVVGAGRAAAEGGEQRHTRRRRRRCARAARKSERRLPPLLRQLLTAALLLLSSCARYYHTAAVVSGRNVFLFFARALRVRRSTRRRPPLPRRPSGTPLDPWLRPLPRLGNVVLQPMPFPRRSR